MESNDTKPMDKVSDQTDEQSPIDTKEHYQDIEKDVFAKQEGLFTSGTSEMPA